MTPKQHFRRLQLRLEIAEFGMGMPLDRERVKELREQVEQARKDAEQWRCGMCETKFPEPDNHLCPSCDSDEIELMTSDGVE